MKKLLTAYNKDVQKYMTGNELSSKRKSIIIKRIEEIVSAAGESFERLFPSRSKRKDVMDHIIYLLSGNGICKIASKTLAEKTDCSIRTVNAAVNALKKTGEVIVAGLADGKNKYVFVLKSHENFQAIMKDVFYINAEQIAEENAGQVAEQENVESLEAVSVEGEKTGSNINNSFNSFKDLSKQEKDSIKDSIESNLKFDNESTEREQLKNYYVNPFQTMFYDIIKENIFHPDIEQSAAILGLRLGSNATKAYLNLALQAVGKLDRFLRKGGIVEDSIPAMFTKMYGDLIKSAIKPAAEVKEFSVSANAFPFVNWLEEDLSKLPAQTKKVNCTIDTNDLNEIGVF
ncbi:cytosolic protein [Bacillus badius]|uniref:cytosolic protein n=1 Tax=Bacillus badius TaxID=1455 RepID=UPI001CBB274F|nr:cytosolic protein [Bacillus badius]UAT29484.1 cytosolic protein [Bacillus badius]